MICGGITETRAIARVVQDGREISDEYSEKVFHWTRESGDAQADAAWNAAHSGMREITLTAADVPNKAVLRCSITGTADAYGAMVADATNLGLTHQKGDLDAGHTFGVEEGNLMLYIPFVEPEALPSDPEVDATEEIPALDMDNGDLSDPEVEEGGTPETDIPEVEDGGDVGSGTYIPGEEEAPDYDDPINDLPDPVYVPESAIPDEDTAKIPKGISYLLEDGELKIVMGLGDVLTAWATVYNTEPDEQLDFKYDANGLRVQKVYTTLNVTETTDYILHGKLITHLTKKCVPSSGTATTEQLHFFYDKSARPAMVEYNNTLYYYRHNLQGDIVEIIDGNGNVMVNYTYDAWGAPTGIEGTLKTTLGELNPFRYRGYVWDKEANLYYLRNRYYSSAFARFINCDSLILVNHSLNSNNLFAYCKNSPIVFGDAEGLQSYIIIAAYTTREIYNDWGHAEIGIMNSGDDIEIYSYGRYADESGKYDLTGPGILVIYDGKETWAANRKKGREGIAVALKASDEEVARLREFVQGEISKGTKYNGSIAREHDAYQIEDYNILFSNCTVFVGAALNYAYRDKLPKQIKKRVMPASLFFDLALMVKEKNDMVAKYHMTWKELLK